MLFSYHEFRHVFHAMYQVFHLAIGAQPLEAFVAIIDEELAGK
jgi:hypothetical protein